MPKELQRIKIFLTNYLKHFSVVFSVILHAIIFLWAFQMEITSEEWGQIKAKSPEKNTLSYVKTILREEGLQGIIAALYDGNSEILEYYGVARLTLHGDPPQYWIDAAKRGSGYYMDRRVLHGENIAESKPAISVIDAKRPLPYRDVLYFHPPGVLVPIIVPGLLADDYKGYYFIMGAWLGLLYMFNLFFGLRLMIGRRPTKTELNRMLWWSVGFLLLFGNIAAARLDHYLLTLMLISAFFFSRGVKAEKGMALIWFMGFGVFCAVGFMTKIVPVLMFPVAMLILALQQGSYPWRKAISAVLGFVAGLICLHLLFLHLFGPLYMDCFLFHLKRGIHIESLYGGIIILAGVLGFIPPPGVVYNFGSINLLSPFTGFVQKSAFPVFIVILGMIFIRVWQARRHTEGIETSPSQYAVYHLILINMIALIALMLFNKVLSPQHLLWVSPTLAALVAIRTEMRAMGILFLLVTLLTQLIFPFFYDFLIRLHPMAVTMLFLRNTLFLGLLFSFLYYLPGLLFPPVAAQK